MLTEKLVESGPDTAEMEKLVTLFNQGRYIEGETLARALKERFPQHGFGWKALCLCLKRQGMIEAAVELMRHSVELLPEDEDAINNLGNTLQEQGQFAEAEIVLRRALVLKPDFALAHNNSALMQKKMGLTVEAEVSFHRALEINPHYAESHNNLGDMLQEQNRFSAAEASYRRALEIRPDHASVLNNLGFALKEQKHYSEAADSFRCALEIAPDFPMAHNNLGIVLKEQGQHTKAQHCYSRALEINPTYTEAFNNLGVALKAQGQFSEAVANYYRALVIRPDYFEAHNNLGSALDDLGQLSEAEASQRRALAIKPDNAEAHNNLGITLQMQNRLTDAMASLRRALEIKSGFAEPLNNLGNVQKDLGLINEALDSYRRAMGIKPDYAEAHNNFGNALMELGRLSEAEVCLGRALEIKPDFPEAYCNMLFALNYHPDKSGEEIFAAYREYDTRFGLPHCKECREHSNNRETNRRLKVGYVSPDFKRHSMRHFLEPLLSRHDKNEVEVYAYAELVREDEVTQRYKEHVDHWILTAGQTDHALAERIRADEIDILVDLAGHTARNRLGMFARKPAPVSLSWVVGYGYTTGLSAVDYLLTDATVAPQGSEGLFSETPWRLRPAGYPYRPAEGMGEVSRLPAMERGYVTFGTLTRAVRINHRTIRVWSEILKRVEGSRLIIDSRNFEDAAMQDLQVEKFEAHGISRNRLEIGFHSPPWDVLRGIDIGLDCFPHNSGTTLFETLYMGVPFVTLAGRPSVGRLGSAILEGVGHPEWIARTEEEYVEKAVALAANLARLADLRTGLRREMENGTLMDEAGFARRMEAAYREMFAKWASR